MITYSDIKEIDREQLERLFLSVDWESGKHPEKLKMAIANYDTVFTAWDGDMLIGLVSGMDDGVMTAYIHYLLVDPKYQGRGVGRALMEMIKERYRLFHKIALIAENDAVRFYEGCGLKQVGTATPMYYLQTYSVT